MISVYSNPQAYADIPGTKNCLCKDIGFIKIYQLEGCAEWLDDDHRLYPNKIELRPSGITDCYHLFGGFLYEFRLPELKVPEGYYGLVLPRSTLVRMGLKMTPSALWDPGYRGSGVITVTCMIDRLLLATTTKPFVFALFDAGICKPYDGKYQGEQA